VAVDGVTCMLNILDTAEFMYDDPCPAHYHSLVTFTNESLLLTLTGS
jgi:hypothetical protein